MNLALKGKLTRFWLKSVKQLNTPVAMIEFACRRHAETPLLIDAESGRTMTFSEMRARAGRLAAFFRDRLRPGDVVAYVAPNTAQYFEIRTAAHLAGLVFMPLSASLPTETVLYFLAFAEAKALLHGCAVPLERILANGTTTLILDIDSPAYATRAENGVAPPRQPVAVDPDDIATYNVSSGTTQGVPKVVKITHRAWVASFYQLMRTAIPTATAASNRYLCAMPYATAGSTSFLPILMAGMTVVIVKEPFPPASLVAAAKTYRASRLFTTPSQLFGLLDHCREHEERLPDLALLITGTEHAPVPLLRECVEWFGPKIVCGYGMVEALPPLTQLPPPDYRTPHGAGLRADRLKTAGRVVGEVALDVLDDRGQAVPTGQLGRIAVRGDTVSSGYLNNPEENAACFLNGRFLSSDYGFLDDDGFLHVQGRQQDIVARRPDGAPVFARELEDRFYELPCVRQCAAAVPDSAPGPVLYVVLRRGANADDARRELDRFRAALDPRLRPTAFVLRPALPVTPLGKLDRRSLATHSA
jgi:long-chain acyl-CoA synthetase